MGLDTLGAEADMPGNIKPPPDPVTESPVYWFVILEQARERFDFQRAALAKAELERLGVRVSYARRGRPKGGDHAA